MSLVIRASFFREQTLSVEIDASSVFGFTGYPTPLATPTQSVPSSPTLSPCRSPVSHSSPECIDPHKLFSFDANEDSGMLCTDFMVFKLLS